MKRLKIIYLFLLVAFLKEEVNFYPSYSFRRVKPSLVATDVFSRIKANWNCEDDALLLERVEILFEEMRKAGVEPSSLPEYSKDYLELYLSTVLNEEGLVEREKCVQEAVILAKRIIEIDDFQKLLEDPELKSNYPELFSLLEVLRRDFLYKNFSSLSTDDKDELLEVIARTLPYEMRLVFYTAFKPSLFNIYSTLHQQMQEEAEKFFYNQIRVCFSKFRIEALFINGKECKERDVEKVIAIVKEKRAGSVEIWGRHREAYQRQDLLQIKIYAPEDKSISLRALIPTHKVSPDIGAGSLSFRKRSEEIENGIQVPILVLQLIGEDRTVRNYIADGHARALAYLKKGIEEIPTFTIRVTGFPIEYTHLILEGLEKQRLLHIEDIELKPLGIPETVRSEEFSAGIIPAKDREEFLKLFGDTLIKRIVDTVREKGNANILVGMEDYSLLIEALQSNPDYGLYLDDWNKVRITVYLPYAEKKKEAERAVWRINQNPGFIYGSEELKRLLGEGENFDFLVTDLTSISNQELATLLEKVPAIIGVNNRSEFCNYGSEWGERILNNPENLVLGETNTLKFLLPLELRSSPVSIELTDYSSKDSLNPLVSAVQKAVEDEKKRGMPAIVAIDGWIGSGRSTLVLKTLLELLEGYRSATINVDSYRITPSASNGEIEIALPGIGEENWSELNIGIRRVNSDTIKILTSFDEIEIKIPPVGGEIKLAEQAIFIRRRDKNTLEIRISPGMVNLDLGSLYHDIQRLRRRETVYVPVLIDNHRGIMNEEVRTALIETLQEMGETVRSINGRDMIYLSVIPATENALRENYSGRRLWLDVKTGEVFYEIEPSQYDLIFVSGELTLHHKKINPLYSLTVFVDADFRAREERLIREHLFLGFYDQMTVEELREYLRWQRVVLEDEFLFRDRTYADYLVLNHLVPTEDFLREYYGMSLGERIEYVQRVADKERERNPWKILENYVLPVIAQESILRTALNFILETHQKNPYLNKEYFLEMCRKKEAPFDRLQDDEFLILLKLIESLD